MLKPLLFLTLIQFSCTGQQTILESQEIGDPKEGSETLPDKTPDSFNFNLGYFPDGIADTFWPDSNGLAMYQSTYDDGEWVEQDSFLIVFSDGDTNKMPKVYTKKKQEKDSNYSIGDNTVNTKNYFAGITLFEKNMNPIPEHDNNLFRDDCGNWYRREFNYSSWTSKPVAQERPNKTKPQPFRIDPTDSNCYPPNNYTEFEYRLDLENKIEWSREVVVKYIKLVP
jgi:hypothetical protein